MKLFKKGQIYKRKYIEIKRKQILLLAHLGKMDKRIRPFEDIAPLNVRKMFILITKIDQNCINFQVISV